MVKPSVLNRRLAWFIVPVLLLLAMIPTCWPLYKGKPVFVAYLQSGRLAVSLIPAGTQDATSPAKLRLVIVGPSNMQMEISGTHEVPKPEQTAAVSPAGTNAPTNDKEQAPEGPAPAPSSPASRGPALTVGPAPGPTMIAEAFDQECSGAYELRVINGTPVEIACAKTYSDDEGVHTVDVLARCEKPSCPGINLNLHVQLEEAKDTNHELMDIEVSRIEMGSAEISPNDCNPSHPATSSKCKEAQRVLGHFDLARTPRVDQRIIQEALYARTFEVPGAFYIMLTVMFGCVVYCFLAMAVLMIGPKAEWLLRPGASTWLVWIESLGPAMGFALTVVGLAAAMQIPQDAIESEQLFRGAVSVALASTLIGLMIRIFAHLARTLVGQIEERRDSAEAGQ